MVAFWRHVLGGRGVASKQLQCEGLTEAGLRDALESLTDERLIVLDSFEQLQVPRRSVTDMLLDLPQSVKVVIVDSSDRFAVEYIPWEGPFASVVVGDVTPRGSADLLRHLGVSDPTHDLEALCAGCVLTLCHAATLQRDAAGSEFDLSALYAPRIAVTMTQAPSADHRRAFERLASARRVASGELAQNCAPDVASHVLRWLSRQPFVESDNGYLAMHPQFAAAAAAAVAIQGGPGPVNARLEPKRQIERKTFTRAVKDALRGYARADRLRHNRLLESERVSQLAGSTSAHDRTAALQRWIRESCARLEQSPKTQRHAAVLHRAYLEPAVKGLVAAGELGMAYGTYRRHVTQAVAMVADAMWDDECDMARVHNAR